MSSVTPGEQERRPRSFRLKLPALPPLAAVACPAAAHRRDPRQPADRIAEAEREGWLGEVEGLKVSLAGADDKLAQIDRCSQSAAAVTLGMPGFPATAVSSKEPS